jgi:hypothetical protein
VDQVVFTVGGAAGSSIASAAPLNGFGRRDQEVAIAVYFHPKGLIVLCYSFSSSYLDENA